MTAVFDVDPQAVQPVLGGHSRFASPFAEPNGYSILAEEGFQIKETAVVLYLDKLREAVKNADALIRGAFRPEFFGFYGINRKAVGSPEEMCTRLVFDSFVLDLSNASVGACLSNREFLFGHFIECWWDRDWKVLSLTIC